MSEYNQLSFVGGMSLLGDDTRLQPNQYRLGLNVRNRYDVLDLVLSSTVDVAAPIGVKQELVTFGNYVILFVAGRAYYRYYTDTGWKVINGFTMSPNAPRYWTCAVPVATTNYGRLGVPAQTSAPNVSDSLGGISSITSAFAGNLPGLIVQDGTNQPQFIFLDASTGLPVCRTTQTFAQWAFVVDATSLVISLDEREYVPVGTVMAFVNGVLYVAAQDGVQILRSVSGRPLDFVVNVNPDGTAGGDAFTTSYTVGVGGISALRPASNNALLVTASNAVFSVTQNMTQNAPTEFGEYTFIRTFLFNDTCLDDRCIIDSLGDTRFIDLTGVRSFNAVAQQQNEGRNSVFSAQIQSAFNLTASQAVVQASGAAAAILYDNYELYAVNTVFGAAIAVYDTLNQCWTGFDTTQTGGVLVKAFAKIELTVQRLYALGVDDKLYQLYVGPTYAPATLRTVGISANQLYENENVKLNNPKSEIKPSGLRVILNRVTTNTTMALTVFMNNRLPTNAMQTKAVPYTNPATTYTGPAQLNDVNTQLSNLLFSLMDCGQGWKMFGVMSWSSGSLTQFSLEATDVTPINPLLSQR